jgi:radical SAM enzyme (TIGR01210 family)
VFCDLWQYTSIESVSPGDIPAQLDLALGGLAGRPATSRQPRWIKLYNAGSFFDLRAIPPADHPAIARRVAGFERVIVECHPSLVGSRVLRFRDLLDVAAREAGLGHGPVLEVAMGLETINPEVFPHLNKQVTPERFQRAAGWLRNGGVDVRAFVLVQPPFEAPGEAVAWAVRSTGFAFDAGAGVVALIPVRPGNGALEALRAEGKFEPPTLETLEAAVRQALGVGRGRGRVFADLWDLGRFSRCPACLPRRQERLEQMNRTQRVAMVPAEPCLACSS